MYVVEEYVNKIIAAVPEGYILKYRLVGSLNDIADSSKYRAPEAQMLSFRQVEQIVNVYVLKLYNSVSPEELPNWVKQVISLLYEMHGCVSNVAC